MTDLIHSFHQEFDKFLKHVFDCGGIECVANCLPFIMGAFAVTRDGAVIAANNEFIDLIGYDRDELYGMSAFDLSIAEDHDLLRWQFGSDVPERYALRLLSKSGAEKDVMVSPRLFIIDGETYRLAEFIDRTPLENHQRLEASLYRKTSAALGRAIEQRDPYTQNHMSRTAFISMEISKTLQLGWDMVELIGLGAGMHDIGKVAVPIEILTKPGKLDEHEWAFVRRHPEIGFDILADVGYGDVVMNIVKHHHEHRDGSGYPSGLKENDIPLEAAIVCVADNLEAIAGVRPYRKSNTFEEAITIMNENAHKFHEGALSAARDLVASGQLAGKEFGAAA